MSENFLRAESDKPIAPPFALSAVRRMHSNWRYLWPFKSRRTVWMISLFGGGMLLPIMGVLLLCELGAYLWLVVGGLGCFTYMIFYSVLPARMTITTSGEAWHLADEVKYLLLSMGYFPSDATGNAIYEPGHAHFYPTLIAKDPGLDSVEQEIDFYCRGNKIELCGPLNTLQNLYTNLASRLEA
jgi:hypothetical protein